MKLVESAASEPTPTAPGARARQIQDHDLVRLRNDLGSFILRTSLVRGRACPPFFSILEKVSPILEYTGE